MKTIIAYGFIFVYVVTLGVATYLQKPAMKDLTAYQINLLILIGGLPPAALALLFKPGKMPGTLSILAALGIGVLIGAGSLFYFLGLHRLPVSIAATIADTYVVITVVMAAFLSNESMGLLKIVGIALTVIGVSLVVWQ